MDAALQIVVGAIIAALGANLIVMAPDDAAAEREAHRRWLWGPPTWMEPMRRWSNRLLGLFFVLFGLAICVDAFV